MPSTLQLIFSDQALPTEQTKSVFLAGPSPRRGNVADWRHEALTILERTGFAGTVLIPIPKNRFYPSDTFEDEPDWTYNGQVQWECQAREMADTVLFWIARSIDRTVPDLGMPGFTTNVEYGEDLGRAKLVYGRPKNAVKMSYLDQRAKDNGLQVHDSLESAISEVTERLGEGSHRMGGAAQVPLLVWKTPSFQSWYLNLVEAGNRLDGAQVLSLLCFGSSVHPFIFCYMVKVNVWVASEKRHKSNEIIVARPDTSVVVAVGDNMHGVKSVVLVREFRSPVNNVQGMVYEFPGGSTTTAGLAMSINAQQEMHEETGLHIEDVTRFKVVGCRQLAATFSTHRASVYTIALTSPEMRILESSKGMAFGEPAAGASGERTYVEVVEIENICEYPVDYSTIGMLHEALKVLD